MHAYSIVDRWVSAAPDRLVLTYGDQSLTWAALDRRAKLAAGALRGSGLGVGDHVAVLDKNHGATYELTLAASLAGVINTPVNFRLAPAEIEYILRDSRAKLAFVGPDFLEIVTQMRGRLPDLERVIALVDGLEQGYEAWLAAAEPLEEPVACGPEDAFLQLYSSGTTGFPKGVMLTHRGLLKQAQAFAEYSHMGTDTVSLVAMPLFHVGGISWSLQVMFAGGRIVLIRELPPDALLDVFREEAVTHTFLVPAAIPPLLEDEARARASMSTLRYLCYGGSPMPLPLVRKCREVLTNDCLCQVYGMTELAGCAAALSPLDHHNEALLTSIGRALPNDDIKLRIVDPSTMRDVSDGEVGELWWWTEQKMSGYWNRPEATEETIVEGGWLRSGDAGYRDADGYVFLRDRVKDMYISGGENVYPAEVERVLIEHPDIAEVAVIGVPDERWGETGKAVVVAVAGHELDTEELIAYCRERLARYKCPSEVEVVEALPRNATGKILKRELRASVVPN